jgi:hypothetical protein
MTTNDESRSTPPTDFAPSEQVLRHGRTHRSAGHRAATEGDDHPSASTASAARGTAHRARLAGPGEIPGETMFGRLRARLSEPGGGE